MKVLGTRELRRRVQSADLAAVASVRGLIREELPGWGASPGLVEVAELLASELLSNALVHAGGDALFIARFSDDTLYVEVHDPVARGPRLRRPSEGATSGRGLLLIQALADAWGVRPRRPGKAIWFEVKASGG